MPLNLPSRFYAGDTLAFTDSVSSYSAADGYTLKYVLVNGKQTEELASVAEGSDHKFDIAATTTKNFLAGGYRWVAYAEKGAERYTLAHGRIEVLPDLTAGPSDQRHHVEKVLEAIEATLEGKATVDQQSYQIQNRSVTRYSIPELLKWRDKYKAELRGLIRAENLANGKGNSAKIQVRI